MDIKNINEDAQVNQAKRNFISKELLLESNIQFGHLSKIWHPTTKPFIYKTINKMHVFDLNKTVKSMTIAFNAVGEIIKNDGKFLFVGSSKNAKETIKENALRSGSYYVNERWLGGLLTNWKTIQELINKLKQLERMNKLEFVGYKKKEILKMKKEMTKLDLLLGGIRHMRKLPQAIFVSSILEDDIAIKEAKKMGIPVFGIVDTNANPNVIDFPIIGNDDSPQSISLVTTIIADAINFVKTGETILVYKSREDAQVIGYDKEAIKSHRVFFTLPSKLSTSRKDIEERKKVRVKLIELRNEPRKYGQSKIYYENDSNGSDTQRRDNNYRKPWQKNNNGDFQKINSRFKKSNFATNNNSNVTNNDSVVTVDNEETKIKE